MSESRNEKRPPVVVVMGHVDHGKSTLLDYIRSANTVDGEAGGITQHTAAYEVTHKGESGKEERITFIDTPGHAAFSQMRERGARVADIAILVVAADDGVKAQTKEALSAIKEAGVPFIVAINKIDKPNADVDKAKQSLAEIEVYVEGWGGDTSVAEISAKTGDGIPDLLDLILLAAELEELSADPSLPASGIVIESHLEAKRGTSATLIITEGTLEKGMCIAAGDAISPVRAIEDMRGKQIDKATFSSPVAIVGFNKVPDVGETFKSFPKKKDAEVCAMGYKNGDQDEEEAGEKRTTEVPLVIKADVAGTLEALTSELTKLETEEVGLKILASGVGTITEGDIKVAIGSDKPIILGFNVKTDKHAIDVAEKMDVQIENFDIIYKMTEWLEEEIKKRTPIDESEQVTATISVLKTFSKTKDKQVLGGSVDSGAMSVGRPLRVMRRDAEIGRGKVMNLQQSKNKTSQVEAGNQFGAMIESKVEIVAGDTLEIL